MSSMAPLPWYPVPRRILLLALGQSNKAGWTQPNGLSVALDPQDDRIRVLASGRGAQLLTNEVFTSGVSPWTSPNGTLSIHADGSLRFVPSAGSFPYATYGTVTGLTIGQTYELEADILATGEIQIQLVSATLVASTKYLKVTGGIYYTVCARFTATATSHAFNIVSNSGSTPTGTELFRSKRVSCRHVQSGGISYPKAVEPIHAYMDVGNAAALGASPAMTMSHRLLVRKIASQVTIYPGAVGGAGLVDDDFDPVDPGYLYTAVLNALTAGLEDDPWAYPIMTWLGGEADATALRGLTTYVESFKLLAKGLRAVPGAERMPIIVFGMVPEYILSNAAVREINAAHMQLPNEIGGLKFIPGPTGYQKAGEPYHYNAAGAREVGRLLGNAVDLTI
jgi:hypothetical protein